MADEKEPVQPIVRKKDDEAASAAPRLSRRVVDMSAERPRDSRARGESEPSPTLQSRAALEAAGPQPGVRVESGSLADFEALLAESGSTPRRERVEVGEKVQGTITSVGEKWIYVDLGGGREGVARTGDFVGKDGEVTVSPQEVRSFYVLSTSDGTITLGEQLSTREAAMDAIDMAVQSGAPLSGRVVSKNKGGFEVDLGGVRAFCPISQIELGFTENPDEHVGRAYQFRVTEVREGGRSVVVSRAELLREEQERAARKLLEELKEGMVVDGTVTRLADFGAFVDIGGVEGLVHVTELGFTRVDHPRDVVREGEKVRVKVLGITEGERGLRISLSMKETMADPWEAALQTVHVGAKLSGVVNRLEPFGAFVEVAPHVEGLVHVSEMSWEKHVKRPSDIVSVGQQVQVEVLDVDLARRRISLSMKSEAADPWSNVTDRFAIGQEVSGTVENIEDFGAFVSLGAGVTALLPRGEMGLSGNATPHARFSRGDTVSARVLSIEPSRRRMSLTLKSAEEVADAASVGPRSYADRPASSGLGTLGDLLKDKLK